MKKAQTWSLDLLIAVGLFMIIFVGAYVVINMNTKAPSQQEIAKEAEVLTTNALNPEEIGIIVGNEVDIERLNTIASINYSDLKNKLGIKSDFCIYFTDEFGNLVDISNETNRTKDGYIELYSIGGGDIIVGGKPCGQR